MWLLIALSLLGKPEVCNSTIFGMEGDRLAGRNALLLRRPVDPLTDMGVAHRSLPLGSLVIVEIPAKQTWAFAVVIDRGPYGRIRPEGSECPAHGYLRTNGTCWTNGAYEYRECRNAYPQWKHWKDPRCYYEDSWWNGCLDLSPALANTLDHDGWARVRVRVVRGVFFSRRQLLALWGGGTDV